MKNPNRLYKNKRKGKFLGVCAGVADYFDLNPALLRVLTIIGCFVFPFMVPFAYFLAALLLDDKPQDLYRDEQQEKFYQSMRQSSHDTLSKVKHRFSDLDERLRRMEGHVTSKQYQFDQELKR